MVPLFFKIFYLLESTIEICLKYFLDKKSQKQTLWKERKNGIRQKVQKRPSYYRSAI